MTLYNHEFEVGDIVRLKNGSSPQTVTHVHDRHISTKYVSGVARQIERSVTHFHLVRKARKKKTTTRPKEDHMTTPNQETLYQTNDAEPAFGTYVAENAKGRIILAMEDGYRDFDPKEIKEVIPHTVQIEFADGKRNHYKVPEDKLEKDDLIMMGSKFGQVIEVNTECRAYLTPPKPIRKLQTTAIC